MPCGCGTREALGQASKILCKTDWERVPAVRMNRVYAVDAARFSRPSLRLVEGLELPAHLFHSDYFEWLGPADACSAITASTCV
jgi:iron complex transport system substrate-binding protein